MTNQTNSERGEKYRQCFTDYMMDFLEHVDAELNGEGWVTGFAAEIHMVEPQSTVSITWELGGNQ